MKCTGEALGAQGIARVIMERIQGRNSRLKGLRGSRVGQ